MSHGGCFLLAVRGCREGRRRLGVQCVAFNGNWCCAPEAVRFISSDGLMAAALAHLRLSCWRFLTCESVWEPLRAAPGPPLCGTGALFVYLKLMGQTRRQPEGEELGCRCSGWTPTQRVEAAPWHILPSHVIMPNKAWYEMDFGSVCETRIPFCKE